MKITRERTNKHGKRIVTVELDNHEHIMAINPDRHYKTGYPIEDVITGHIILDSVPVTWCSIRQEWVS